MAVGPWEINADRGGSKGRIALQGLCFRGKTTKCTPVYYLDYHMTGISDILGEVFHNNF